MLHILNPERLSPVLNPWALGLGAFPVQYHALINPSLYSNLCQKPWYDSSCTVVLSLGILTLGSLRLALSNQRLLLMLHLLVWLLILGPLTHPSIAGASEAPVSEWCCLRWSSREKDSCLCELGPYERHCLSRDGPWSAEEGWVVPVNLRALEGLAGSAAGLSLTDFPRWLHPQQVPDPLKHLPLRGYCTFVCPIHKDGLSARDKARCLCPEP